MRGAQAGHASDVEALFRAYWRPALRAAFLVVHDAAAAEDIAQEAFLAAIRRLHLFDRRRPFGPWLHRIVVNRAIDWTRTRQLRAETALVDTGVWADINRIHAVNYTGPHYTTVGPLQVWRSPQGQPVLVQAGSSPQGRDFAARVAEIVFSIQTRFEDAVDYYADIKNRARQYGRDPRHLAILPGLSLVIGSTEAEAFARLSELDELATGRSSIEAFAARLGIDPSDLDPDKPFPEHLFAKLDGAQFKQRSAGVSSGHRAARSRLLQDRSVTVRQIVARGGGGHYRFVGTPEQIVDFMEKWVDEGAADGFNLFMDVYPEGLETFADQVIPLLQKRGRFRRNYEEKTLRERFRFPRPARILPAGARSVASLLQKQAG